MDIDQLIEILQKVKDEYGDSCYVEAYTDQLNVYDRLTQKVIKSIFPSFD